MVNSIIILYAFFAGFVAILVTVSIEKFGGFIGGVLGTVPSTIIPAAAGVYAIDGGESLRSSMSVVPLGMLINGLFLGVWILLPNQIKQENLMPASLAGSPAGWLNSVRYDAVRGVAAAGDVVVAAPGVRLGVVAHDLPLVARELAGEAVRAARLEARARCITLQRRGACSAAAAARPCRVALSAIPRLFGIRCASP